MGKFSGFPIDLRFGVLDWVFICPFVLQFSYCYRYFLSVVPHPYEFMPFKKIPFATYSCGEIQEKEKFVVCLICNIL